MTVQILPIEVYNNTWGDVLNRVNDVIAVTSTQTVTVGGDPAVGDAVIQGEIDVYAVHANTIAANTGNIGNFTANSVTINNVNTTVATTNTITVTGSANIAILSATTLGSNTVSANSITSNTINANTGAFKNLTSNTASFNSLDVSTVSSFETNSISAQNISANTFTSNSASFNNILVNGINNIQKLSAVPIPTSSVFTSSANGDVQFDPITNFGRGLIATTTALNARNWIGLGNVQNTSDLSKPISTATQNALNLKANANVRVNVGTGLTGGGALTGNVTVSLNANTVNSLARADTALQLNEPGAIPLGGTTGQVLSKASNDPYDVRWTTTSLTTAVQFIPQSLTEDQKAAARNNIGVNIASYALKSGSDRLVVDLSSKSDNISFRSVKGSASGTLGFSSNGSASLNLTKSNGSAGVSLYGTGTSSFADGLSIGGALTVSGASTFNSSVTSKSADSFRIAATNKGVFWRNNDSYMYMMITADGDPFGTWNNLRPIQVTLSSGLVHHGHSLTVTGTISATGNITGNSDARIKDDIKTIDNATEIVTSLRGCSYNKHGVPTYGFIAQEVEQVLPEIVHEPLEPEKDEFYQRGERPTLSIDQGNEINAVLVEAFKEAIARIETLESKIKELESKQ